MKISIIGAGNVGGNLGKRLANAGYSFSFGVKEDKDLQELLQQCKGRATALPVAEAVANADLLFLAVPGSVVLDMVKDWQQVDDKIIVDCTNPVKWDAGPVWDPPKEGSIAAALAASLPGASIVKGWNTFGAEYHLSPEIQGEGISVFLAGEESAKAKVSELAEALGFSVVDAGPLRNASVLENVALLWIHLATVGGQGRDIALQLLRRSVS